MSLNEKPKFVIDVVLSLTFEELTALKQLSVHTGTSVEFVARDCMMRRCQEDLAKVTEPDVIT